MKFENIVKQLKKQGYNVEPMEFSFKFCLGVTGTALIDIVDGEIKPTSAKFNEVLKQIKDGKSHIYNVDIIKGCNKKSLSSYLKL